MLLLIFVYLFSTVCGEYTYWKYGDNSRVLPETQQYFKYISSYAAIQSDLIDVDWLRYPVITSTNDILVHGYNQKNGQIILFQFDQHLNLMSQLMLASNVYNYTNGYRLTSHGYFDDYIIKKNMVPIYHEYENNNYYIHYLTLINRTSQEIAGKLLVVKLQKYEMHILWQFDHHTNYTNGRYYIYQPLVYNGRIWFQYKHVQTERSFIKRYLFSVHDGSVIWNKTNFIGYDIDDVIHPTPIIFHKYNQISVIYGTSTWDSGALFSFDFMTGDLNWYRNYSEYYTDYVIFRLQGTSAIYHKYDLLIQGGWLDDGSYGFSHLSAFNLSNTGEMVSYPLSNLYDHRNPFVCNFRNGRNDLIMQFKHVPETWDTTRCPAETDWGSHFIQQIHIQKTENDGQFKFRFDFEGRYPYASCEIWSAIRAPIDSYSSLISSDEKTNHYLFDSSSTNIFVVTNNGRGNMIRSPGDYPMIPNHNDHNQITSQLMYFINHDGNSIVAHYNTKHKSTSSPIIWMISVTLGLSFVGCLIIFVKCFNHVCSHTFELMNKLI